MELFGPDFLGFSEEAEEAAEEAKEKASPAASNAAPGAVDKAKKGKLNAKSTGLKYQFQIMLSIGVPREEIKKFADSLHWLTYFPPITIVRVTYPRHAPMFILPFILSISATSSALPVPD